MKSSLYSIIALVIVMAIFSQSATSQQNSVALDSILAPVKYRSIGPFRGGRSVTATGISNDPLSYYMGTTGGGLWKTEDAGQHWNNISDGYFKTGSVGAVAVSESDPNIVYVGMGEHAPRGVMTSHGDGVYKSIDAGKTWNKIGLDLTQHISRIQIHPKNPDILYVAAQGALYDHSSERGVYKSIDGGATWEKTLFVDNKTGCVELSMDKNYPNILYAAMWEHQRLPWKVISGGPGSGLYKSTDSGKTWKPIQEGLPKELGKMAVSVCRSNSDKVYALIESDSEKDLGGLFVSNNAGETWTRVSDDNRLTQRAWYYIEVFADPQDENTVYVLSAPALRSIDGGKTWERLSGTHGDYHDLWINPENPNNLCIANDGGAAISFNQGTTWSTQSTMPTGQFYRLNVDNNYPYRIYAGQQDYGSVRIESKALKSGSIGFQNWTASAGGESAFLAFDPDNAKHVLGGSYQGTISVLDVDAKAATKIMPAPIEYLGMDAKDMKYRYNWNAPIIKSQHEPNTYYHGAQYLLRTKDMGINWEEASPDLTNNEKEKQGKGGGPYTNEAVGAENYGTLAYVIESPHEAGVIWTGSDDGVVSITRDNGVTWNNVTPKGLKECLINAIDVSPHDPATAYIATTRYKFNDHTPGIYKTTNYGKTWKNISGNIPKGAFTRVVREDTALKGFLIAGTELGIYASWDDGNSWESIQLNLPITPITDIMIKHDDIIVATSGRAFWILDDIGLLRQVKQGMNDFQLFKPEDAMLSNHYSQLNSTNKKFKGTSSLDGVNPANGIVIHYNIEDAKSKEALELTIKNNKGEIVNVYSSTKDSTFIQYDGGPPTSATLTKDKGLNRFVWDMRTSNLNGVTKAYIEANYRGHKVSPGIYTATLKRGDKTSTTEFSILPNPNYNIDAAGYAAYSEYMTDMKGNVIEMHNVVNKLHDMRIKMEEVLSSLPVNGKTNAVKQNGKSLISKLKTWDEEMVQRKSKAYDDVENFPNKFTANYLFMMNQTESDIPKITKPSRDRRAELEKQWVSLKEQGMQLMNVAIPQINKELWDAGVGAIWSDK